MTTGETTMQAGGNRWGDYSAMSVGPVDHCGVWYTNEYIPSGSSWRTRIASFRFDAPDCMDSSGATCGKNVLEIGKECDGTSDAAYPCACDGSCACPVTCDPTDLYVPSGKSDAKSYTWKIEVNNGDGAWNGFDPRNGFGLVVTQGMGSVMTTIPPTTGWERSKPGKGKSLWSGDVAGVFRVKVLDKTATLGILPVKERGCYVTGADTIDVINFYADVQLTMDGHCGGGVY